MSPRAVFLDASLWIALRDAREPFHSQAREVASRVLRARRMFVFTPLILAETHAYFARSERLSWQILDDAENNPAMQWELPGIRDHDEAARLLRTHRDKQWSFCDAVSFAVMRRLGIRQVATFDVHFRQAGGFEILPG